MLRYSVIHTMCTTTPKAVQHTCSIQAVCIVLLIWKCVTTQHWYFIARVNVSECMKIHLRSIAVYRKIQGYGQMKYITLPSTCVWVQLFPCSIIFERYSVIWAQKIQESKRIHERMRMPCNEDEWPWRKNMSAGSLGSFLYIRHCLTTIKLMMIVDFL